MFSADYDSKQGSLMIRYKRRDRLLGVLLVVFGGFTLPVGLTLFLSLGWLSKLPWMVSGLGAITLAGGMLVLLRSRFVPLGFQIDRSTVRILERTGSSLGLPLSFFNECGIRSAEGRRRGPFFVFLRGPAGLDLDLSSDASEKNAARHLQLLCQATALPLPVDSASPEEALRKAFAVPTLDLSRRLDDAAKDLKPLVQRLKSDGRLTLSASGRTLRFRDPAARRHSALSVLFLFFIVAMGMTAFLEGIPVFAAVFVFSILTLIGGWLMLATVRSWLFDDGLSAADGGLLKRRFPLLQRQVADLSDRPATEPSVPVLTFTTQTGVPAVGYFSESYRRQVRNLTLQPLALMSLAYRRFFAYPHRFYGYTLSESIALYSAIRGVFYYGRR